MTNPTNDPKKAGELAAPKQTFGFASRFAIAPVHTRFDAVSWFIFDADRTDDVTGAPLAIVQEDTEELALGRLSEMNARGQFPRR